MKVRLLTTDLKILFVYLLLMVLCIMCNNATAQILGQPVQKYQKVKEVNDSTKIYYSNVSELEYIGEGQEWVSHKEYYVEVNNICVQIGYEYNDFRLPSYIFYFGKLGFTKYTNSRYYKDNKTAEISYDGKTTKVLFTLFPVLVSDLLKEKQ